MTIEMPTLDAPALQRFYALRTDAIEAVAERFCKEGAYAQFGERGREACREDLAFHLEFLRPVLEFGILQPMVDYLRWLATVLAARGVPIEHLPLSLDWLADFFGSNMFGTDADVVVGALHNAKARYLSAPDSTPGMSNAAEAPWPESEQFEAALLAGDPHSAVALFDRCIELGRSLVDTELKMIQPALYRIGSKWQHNQVTVAQEHLATAIAQSVMTRGLIAADVPISNGSKVLLACVAGNSHSIGLQMVADAFQLAGWEVQFLGANVPTDALLQQLDAWSPDLLGLSVSFAQQLRVVKEIMLRLVQIRGTARPAVIVGGLAINQFSRLAGELGADAWGQDAYAAVAAASAFTRKKSEIA